MSKRQVLILLGVWVAIFLFLGFPQEWDKVFSIIAGLLIIFIAIKYRPSSKQIPKEHVTYEEHRSDRNISRDFGTVTAVTDSQDNTAHTTPRQSETISNIDSATS